MPEQARPVQTILINYASRGFRRRQIQSSHSALTMGKVDRCIQYGPRDLDDVFRRRNRLLLEIPRGAGLWVWKPRIILDALSKANDGDVVVYVDSGTLILRDLAPLIRACRQSPQGILCFPVSDFHLERHWTKRDAFVLMDCDGAAYHDTPQIAGGAILLSKQQSSLDIIREWMKLVEQVRLISDLPSLCNLPELDGFCAHRHDQSLFSLLCKKRGIVPHSGKADMSLGHFVQSHVHREPPLRTLLAAMFNLQIYRGDSSCHASSQLAAGNDGQDHVTVSDPDPSRG